MKAKEEPGLNRLGEILTNRLEEKGMSIIDLAKRLETSYEHVRGLVRGKRAPSKLLLKSTCEILKLNYPEMLEIAEVDAIKKKYGTLPQLIAGKKPSMEPLERVWDSITESQQQDIITMAQGWARRAKKAV